jgi:hypothetical protein
MQIKWPSKLHCVFKAVLFGGVGFSLGSIFLWVIAKETFENYFADIIFETCMVEEGVLSLLGLNVDAHPWLILIANAGLGTLLFFAFELVRRIFQRACPGLTEKHGWIINSVTVACLIGIASSPLFFRKNSVRLAYGNRTVGAAENPLFLPCGDTRVYIGNKKIFRLYNGAFEFPLLIHALDYGKRVLCVYENDTYDLVFVVDCNGSKTNTSSSLVWAPYIVKDTEALVRLPTQQELADTIGWFVKLTPAEFTTASFPRFDCGFRKFYEDRELVEEIIRKAPISGSGIPNVLYDYYQTHTNFN